MHIIQFRQHAFPLQRREGRDEKLAVREHREQLITDLLDDCRNTFLHSDNNFSQHFTV